MSYSDRSYNSFSMAGGEMSSLSDFSGQASPPVDGSRVDSPSPPADYDSPFGKSARRRPSDLIMGTNSTIPTRSVERPTIATRIDSDTQGCLLSPVSPPTATRSTSEDHLDQLVSPIRRHENPEDEEGTQMP